VGDKANTILFIILFIYFVEEEALKKYQSRTGRGRKSVAGERYNPEEDDDDEPVKVVPKSDEQRNRLQIASKKVMLLNRLDEVNKLFFFEVWHRPSSGHEL